MRTFIIALALGFSILFSSTCEGIYFDRSIRAGLFFPTNNKAQCLLPFWSPFLQLETNFHFGNCWELMSWTGWANVGFIASLGHFCGNHRAFLVPLSAGIKYSWCLGSLREAYLGFGGSYNWYTSKGSSSRHGFGFVLKSGIRQYYWDCAFAEMFLDYNYSRIRHRNITGIMVGLGIGRIF